MVEYYTVVVRKPPTMWSTRHQDARDGGVLPKRKRHPDKHLEKVLIDAEDRGWVAKLNPKTGYHQLKCPCGEHIRSVAKTPSTPNYERNLRGWLKRCDCWKGETR